MLRTSENFPSRDCLETPKGLPFVVPRACETGCKALFFDASRYQQTRDPTRPATFQTVSRKKDKFSEVRRSKRLIERGCQHPTTASRDPFGVEMRRLSSFRFTAM